MVRRSRYATSLCAIAVIAVSFALPVPVHSQSPAPQSAIHFDIPAQSLGDALFAYSSLTGIEILVPGDLIAGRESSALAGALGPEAALRVLLSGTGLTARYTDVKAFTLLPIAGPVAPAAPWAPRHDRYSAALQAAVTNALCHFQETRPGDYRVAARLWIGSSGAVTRVSFLGTTGSSDRDAALANLLGRVVVDEPPSANVPQPATVLILPRTANSPACRTGAAP